VDSGPSLVRVVHLCRIYGPDHRKLALLPVAWGLIEAPLGTLVGAWLYKE
jgi:hypothetical protein